jgi:hypothetical protein
MPNNSIELDLGDHKLPNWALPAHIPKFKIRCDPLNPSPSQHITFRPFTDVEMMETFKDPRQVKSRLKDLYPSVFDNPAYNISDTGRWLEHIAHGCHVP